METDEQGMYKNYIAMSSIVTSIIDPMDKMNLEHSIGHTIDVPHKESCTDEQMTNNSRRTHRWPHRLQTDKVFYKTSAQDRIIYKHVLKPHRRNSKRNCIGGNVDELTSVKTILGKHVTATLLARTEELN